MDYHMQVSKIPYPSPLTWTIICTLQNFFHFSQNVYYHMQWLEFLSLLQKHGLSFAIFGISFSSRKTWNIISNFRNSYPFSKNVDYHMQFLEFLSLLQNRGHSYAIFLNSFTFSKIVDYRM